MSKHNRRNYTDYQSNFNKPADDEQPIVQEQSVEAEPEVTQPSEVESEAGVTPFEEETIVLGTVKGCKMLNIRKEPSMSAAVVGIIDYDTEVEIDMENSESGFYKICTPAGVEGFCMTKFIALSEQ